MDVKYAEIDIIVGRDGKAQITVQGAPGSSCKDITAPYEAVLGQVTSDTPTSEMRAEAGRSVDRIQSKRG